MSTATETPKTETPATQTPPAAKPTPRMSDDPFMARVLADMGQIVDAEGNLKDVVPDTKTENKPTAEPQFLTMGELARYKAEKKPEDKKEEAKTETDEEKAKREADEKAAADAKAKTEGDKPAADPAAAAKPKVIVEKAKPIEEIVEGLIKKTLSEQPTKQSETPAQPAKKTEDPDAAYVESLTEEQREEISLAEFAAKKNPTKYANLPKRVLDYFKKVDQYIDGKRKEDSEWDPEEDEGFKSFLEENKPPYQPGDRRKLERQQIAEEVKAEVTAEVKPSLDEAAEHRKAQELKPEIDSATEDYRKNVVSRLALDDKSPLAPVIAKLSEKGATAEAWQEAKAIDPLATKIVKRFSDQSVDLGREVIELTTGVAKQTPFKPELPPTAETNVRAIRQQRLFGFIDRQEQIFDKDGGQMKIKDGKAFLPRRQFYALSQTDQAKYWTLGAQDVLDMLAIDAGIQAQTAYQAALKEREEEGYVRQTKKEEPKTEKTETKTETKTEASPKATVTPGPGAGTGAPPPKTNVAISEEELKRQWSGGKAVWV